MPYNSSGPGAEVPVSRIYPITNDFVGDLTKGNNTNLQTYVDLHRGAKAPVRVATAAALPAYTRVTNVLTANALVSLNTAGIDGITTLAVGDRVLLANGAVNADNGVYAVTTVGVAATTAFVLTRAADADVSLELIPGALWPVSEGTANANSLWQLTTAGPITVNATSLTFVKFSSGGSGGGYSVLGPVKVITSTSANVYPIPYGGAVEVISAGGVGQIRASDYALNGDGTFSFTPALSPSTIEVTGTSFSLGTSYTNGGGIMSHPVTVAPNGDLTHTIPGSGTEEIVWRGGLPMERGVNYTRSGVTLTWTAGNFPASDEKVMISVALAPLAGTDATTLAGQAASYYATATTVATKATKLTPSKLTTVLGTVAAASWIAYIQALTTASAVTYQLPTGAASGDQLVLKDALRVWSTYPVTVLPPASQTVEGDSTSFVYTPATNATTSLTFIYDGVSVWWLI